ncbi:MAG: RraA family protein, partial [Bacteroidales bacterium]
LTMNAFNPPLTHGEILRLKRWNTPTIYNGWEQVTKYNYAADAFNLEDVKDFMPQMGPMVGYAITVVVEPSNIEHKKQAGKLWTEYREYISSLNAPKIVVVQDLDKPRVIGSFWGEVNANNHKAFGCVGTITDGAVRDVDEMTNAGFKALAKRMCVGHAHSTPVKWGCEVEVFGRKIQPGQLIHADKHGFLAVPFGEEKVLLEASLFMDSNECNTLISAARGSFGKTKEQILKEMGEAIDTFNASVTEKFGRKGEF